VLLKLSLKAKKISTEFSRQMTLNLLKNEGLFCSDGAAGDSANICG
jgi:hypothetical protein